MKYLFNFIAFIFPVVFFSQSNGTRLLHLLRNDSSSAQLLLNYPDSIYTSVLTVAEYPNVLLEIHKIQNTTSASFQNLVSKYNRERQKELWNISRYHELPALIINNKGKRRSELSKIFSKYPPQTKRAAIHFARKDNTVIVQIKNIQNDFNSKYHEALNNYPQNIRTSLNLLLRYPELASVFARDTATTRTLGELYKNDPALTKHIIDSTSKQMAREYDYEYADWKNGISGNPKVAKDMKDLSHEYKKENGYYEEDDVYASGAEEKLEEQEHTYYTRNSYVNPYPYWAGYPSWYATPSWYPYPWWWSTGFYWYPRGPFFFYGMPTYQFGYWYYYHPNNYYYRYPHAGNYFYQHYQNYPGSNSGINQAVRDWNGRRMGGGFPGGGRMGGGFGGGGGRRR